MKTCYLCTKHRKFNTKHDSTCKMLLQTENSASLFQVGVPAYYLTKFSPKNTQKGNKLDPEEVELGSS